MQNKVAQFMNQLLLEQWMSFLESICWYIYPCVPKFVIRRKFTIKFTIADCNRYYLVQRIRYNRDFLGIANAEIFNSDRSGCSYI